MLLVQYASALKNSLLGINFDKHACISDRLEKWKEGLAFAIKLIDSCSRMRSQGSRFTRGVWGLSCVRQTLPKRPQLFAAVRNRSHAVAMAVPLVSSATGVTFGAFQRRIASFRVAGVALCDIPTSFMTCHKWFCVADAILFSPFSEDALHFSWQAQHFGDLRCQFAWQAQHFTRVVLRFFCESYCQRCAKWWQAANSVAGGRRGILWHVMKIDGCLARNVDFEVGPSENSYVGKRRFWSYEVWKLEEVSHERLILRLQHVSPRFSGLLLPSQCLWGKLQNLSLSKDSKQVVMSFCVAGVTLCDIQTCFVTCQKLFCVAGAPLWISPSSFRVAGATL